MAINAYAINGTCTNMYDHALSWWVDDSGTHRSCGFSDNDNKYSAHFDKTTAMRNIAFKMLGMVQISLLPGKFSMRWDINHVDENSLKAARKSIEQAKSCTLFQLDFNYEGWRTEYYKSSADALKRVAQVSAYRGTKAMLNSSFTRQSLDAVKMAHPIMSVGLDYWRERKYHFMDDDRSKKAALLHKWAITTKSNEKGQLFFDKFGEKSDVTRSYPKVICNRLLGKPIDVFKAVDAKLFEATKSVVCDVMDSKQPAFEHVVASSVDFYGEKIWTTKTRLFLPVLKPNGAIGVSIISTQEGAQHIPFMAS